jgi:DNA-damage-inducible protein D
MSTNKKVFDDIKHTTEYGAEFWHARELMPILGYDKWQNFENSIKKAKESCKNANKQVEQEFLLVPVKTLESGGRPGKDYILSRYACYLIAQNGDPRKLEIAKAQTYFAVQTRKQEANEQLLEDKRRMMLRNEMKHHNLKLAEAAKGAGIIDSLDYAIFQNFGYKGLYDGLDMKGIHKKKELKKSQKILDHMGSTELAANLFRATQAEEKLKKENIQGKQKANKVHYNVGKTVRKTIKEIGGTMPEDLTASEGIGRARTRIKKNEKKSLEKRIT